MFFSSTDSLTVLREEDEDDDALNLTEPPTIELRGSKRDVSLDFPRGSLNLDHPPYINMTCSTLSHAC